MKGLCELVSKQLVGRDAHAPSKTVGGNRPLSVSVTRWLRRWQLIFPHISSNSTQNHQLRSTSCCLIQWRAGGIGCRAESGRGFWPVDRKRVVLISCLSTAN